MQVEDGDVDEVEELRVVLDRVAYGAAAFAPQRSAHRTRCAPARRGAQEEKKTMTFFLRFFFKKVKSSRKPGGRRGALSGEGTPGQGRARRGARTFRRLADDEA